MDYGKENTSQLKKNKNFANKNINNKESGTMEKSCTRSDNISLDEKISQENNEIDTKHSQLNHQFDNSEKVSLLEKKILEYQKKERDNLLRMHAERENLKRRTDLDIEKAHKFALERFVNDLLPVIDNLERAIEIVSDKNSAVVEGIQLTLKEMINVMQKFGVKIISEVNVPLKTDIHQAVTVVESDKVSPGNVLSIMQKGYVLNGRTIRAAMVAVARKK